MKYITMAMQNAIAYKVSLITATGIRHYVPRTQYSWSISYLSNYSAFEFPTGHHSYCFNSNNTSYLMNLFKV